LANPKVPVTGIPTEVPFIGVKAPWKYDSLGGVGCRYSWRARELTRRYKSDPMVKLKPWNQMIDGHFVSSQFK